MIPADEEMRGLSFLIRKDLTEVLEYLRQEKQKKQRKG